VRKEILIIGMLDSVHLSKWLKQFSAEPINFTLFPSKKFRSIHPILEELLLERNIANFRISGYSKAPNLAGYLDFLRFICLRRFMPSRENVLKRLIEKKSWSFIHALEIQGAGYLLIPSENFISPQTRVILTNWGSDIYYYKNFPEHEAKIKKVLKLASLYSAECIRDYALAKELGFAGQNLPCIPNSGGIDTTDFGESTKLASARKTIIVKGYGSTFGRVEVVLRALDSILEEFIDVGVFIYSVTDDVLPDIKHLAKKFPGKIEYRTVKKPLTVREISLVMGRSRIYVGCSISDGLSTSFLESMAAGAYPIQTNTSCASEWLKKGAIASLVDIDEKSIRNAIRAAVVDDVLVDTAQINNFRIVNESLSIESIHKNALKFYLAN
jgi:glycosyltransferase involved in cell wall biosynthesis